MAHFLLRPIAIYLMLGWWAALAVFCSPRISAAEPTVEPAAAELEFFEKQIRPLLAQHCYECHGAKKSQANLRLDVAAGWLRGGDSGPAVVPKAPDESLLVQAIEYDGDSVEMPPTGKLPDETIALLTSWVARGAIAPPDRESVASARTSIDLEAGRQFWAYRTPQRTPPPDVRDASRSTHPIDRFVQARLDVAGLRPQPEAPRATLMRRLYFDLWGMPPEPREIDAFEQDMTPDAYEKLVDRLLASPRFGQRFGRQWLDLVRFGESLTLRGFVLPEAWRYRDYVIETFNADRPFDEFVREQIAGDLLPSNGVTDRQRKLVATTFLTLGNTNLEEQDKLQLDMDVVDEQLDTLGKVFLAQTIGCARCHDHKFDPIPTRDYYALAGILRNCQLLEHENVSKWVQAPLPLEPEEEAIFAEHAAAVAALEAELKHAGAQLVKLGGGPRKTPDIIAASELPGIVVDDRQAKKVGRWTESKSVKPYIGDGYVYDDVADKGSCTITFDPELPETGRYEVRLAYTAHSNRSRSVPVTVFSAEGEKTVALNMQEAPAVEGRFVSLGEYRFEVGGQSFVIIDSADTEGHVVADAVQFLPRGDGAPATPAVAEQDQVTATAGPNQIAAPEHLATLQAQIKQLEKRLKQLRASGPQHPEVMTVRERAEIHDLPVHVRGSVHSLGELVPRGFLQVVSPAAAGPLPSSQSGRRELADWLASPDNPLTARVYANRVWYWLLGEGLVRSVDNFGSTGEQPSHAELLDHLALRLIEARWSTKSLVRYVVLSQTYRQSSASRDEGLAADPENRLLWRANRRRLEAECLRDAMLAVSGQLSDEIGGSTIKPGTANDYGYVASSVRRSVYLPVLRNSLPEIFEVFDFPDPSLVAGRRNTSTVAPQALFFMNSPLVREQALWAADRLLAEQLPDDEARITQAFRRTLGRAPSDAERDIAREVVAGGDAVSPDQKRRPWSQLFHLLFSSLDFRYRD
jgi:mono/diheme cytochrome c family protein